MPIKQTYDTINMERLPSRGLAYSKDTVLSVRAMTFGEVISLKRKLTKVEEMANLLKENEIVKGIDVVELTKGDFEYLFLHMVSITYAEVKYEYKEKCPHCKGIVKELILPNGLNKQFKGEVKYSASPTEIKFAYVDDQITEKCRGTSPVSVELNDKSFVSIDFYRVKHVITHEKDIINLELEYEKNNEPGLTEEERYYLQARAILGDVVSNLETSDMALIIQAIRTLEHGLTTKGTAKCVICQKQFEVALNWRAPQFTTHSISERDRRHRIRFGVSPTSVDNRSVSTRTSTSRVTIQHT